MIGILELPYLLSVSECKKAIEQIEERNAEQSSIKEDKELADYYRKLLLPRLPKTFEIKDGIIEIENIADKITFCKQDSPIERHTDRKVTADNYLKLSIFLNRTSFDGGLLFDGFYVPADVGKGVLFSIEYPHMGERFPKGEWKYILGLRILGTKHDTTK